MKVVPINTTNNCSFNGLWEKTYKRPAGYEGHYNNYRMENFYHPFADESETSIKSALESKTYQVLVPTPNEYEFDNVVSNPEVKRKLSFTEKEFNAYKSFYEKKIPESVKNIEKELVNNNLSHYLNSQKICAIKRFLHKIRII